MEEKKFEFEMFDEVFKPSVKKPTWSVYAQPVDEFIKSEKKMIKFKFKNTNDAHSGYSGLRNFIVHHNLNVVICKRGIEVYLIKG